ncbi:M23 family metallopeptidase [Bacteroidales bacterium OttesenSCG-928-C19]|nr:M23 family metallopeptidase [Bacteroidales bacterium OttesenSCG-928-C19]
MKFLKKERRKKIAQDLKHKHRFVIMDSGTYQEKFSFRLSGVNLFLVIGISAVVLILLTSVLIVFTPLREYIPGYTQADIVLQSYENAKKVDSLETYIRQQETQIAIIKSIISGEEVRIDSVGRGTAQQIVANPENITHSRSKEDSLLRQEIENRDKYQINEGNSTTASPMGIGRKRDYLKTYLFFNPVRGKVINGFDSKSQHFGIDIAGRENEAVKSIYDGTVLFADWTVGTGNVIIIQHPNNIISVYKHNSSLLKKAGEIVRSGDPIAFIGNSGEYTSGQHLHFELWFDGNPVNPLEYIVF